MVARVACRSLFALLALAAPALAAAGVAWRPLGPWSGPVDDLELDPRDDARLVASAGGRVWETRDAGARWRELVGFARPDEAARVAICDDGVWTSTLPPRRFAGGRWETVGTGLPAAGPLRSDLADGLACVSGGPPLLTIGTDLWRLDRTDWRLARHGVDSFALVPERPREVWGTIGRRLARSRDLGVSWRLVGGALPFPTPRQIVVAHGGSVLHAAVGGELWRSADAGSSWTRLARFPGVLQRFALGPRRTIAAVATSGFWRSVDEGRTWERRFAGRPWLADVAVDRRGTLWLASLDASPDALLRSADGEHWERRTNGLRGGMVWNFAPDPFHPERSWAQLGQFRLVARDRGAWIDATPPGASPGGLVPQGLVADPRRPGVVYTLLGPSLLRSEDGGATWAPVADAAGNAIADLPVFDPVVPDRVFLAGWGGVRRSVDGGRTWEVVLPTGADLSYVREIGRSPADAQRVWAFGFRKGIGLESSEPRLYRSVDGGATWEAIHDRLPGTLSVLAVDPTIAARAFAVTYECCGERRDLLRTDDGGSTWVPVSTLEAGPWLLGVSLRDPGTLIASFDAGRGEPEIRASHDGGITWQRAGELPLRDVVGITEDPGPGGRLYVWGWPGVFATRDRP